VMMRSYCYATYINDDRRNKIVNIHSPIPRHDKTNFILLQSNLCKACWTCIEVCPNGVIGKVDVLFGWHRHARIDFAEQCKGCKKCVITCPNQAIIYTYVPTKKQPE